MKKRTQFKYEPISAQISYQAICKNLAERFFPHITEPHGSKMIEELLELDAKRKKKLI